MRKILFALALISTPAVAEPVIPGPNASFEERLEYVRQLNIEAAEKHKQAVAESEQRLREFNVKVGLPADYQSYGRGKCMSVCTTTVYSRGRVYRFTVFRN